LFDRCQLTITLMSNIKEVRYKPRVRVSAISFSLEYGCHLVLLRRRRRRRACAPTSNTASHDNHEKINSWFFSFVSCMSMVLRLATLRPAGALCYRFFSHLAYLSPARHAITWVSNYRFSNTPCNWIYTPFARQLSAL